jgi:catechol 2,3-dioxygenase-like lactoylglutathione lyase family enzyme
MPRHTSLIDQPVPELPVADVERAQRYYRDVLGFDIDWLFPGTLRMKQPLLACRLCWRRRLAAIGALEAHDQEVVAKPELQRFPRSPA